MQKSSFFRWGSAVRFERATYAAFAMVFVLVTSIHGTSLFAQVDLSTLIRDVVIEEPNQRAGTIRFVVSGDEFAQASPANPVTMRLRIDKGAVLQRTRVDLALPQFKMGPMVSPINLPIRLVDSSSAWSVAAPADAVQIVRWREGENQIWLQFNASSSSWLTRDGDFGPPDADNPVVITLGQTTGEAIKETRPNARLGSANLQVPQTENGQPRSTAIYLDLTGSVLQAFPAPPFLSLLNFDPSGFTGTVGVRTEANPDDVDPGVQIPVFFSGSTEIARGTTASTAAKTWFVVGEGAGSRSVLLHNPEDRTAEIQLQGFDADGVLRQMKNLELAGQSVIVLSLDELFADKGVSHAAASSPFALRTKMIGSGLSESSRKSAKSHLFFAQQGELGLLQAVNTGQSMESIQAIGRNAQGDLLFDEILEIPVASFGLLNLDLSRFADADLATLEIVTEQPLNVLSNESFLNGSFTE